MFLRSTKRKKDGKVHRYFSVVQNRRLATGGTAQRTVLYLGEINDKQEEAWQKSLTVFDQDRAQYTTMSLFPDDRAIPTGVSNGIQVRLGELELRRRRSDAGHLAGTWAGAGEAARHFDAEVDRHDCRRFVMIKEDVVSIGSEAGILVQEGPDLIQRRVQFFQYFGIPTAVVGIGLFPRVPYAASSATQS